MEIVRKGLSYGFSVIVWSRGALHIGQAGRYSQGYPEMYGIRELELREPEALAKRGVTKVIWAGEPGRIARLEEELKACPIRGSECCTSDESYLEFMAEGVNKGAGLRAAAEALGLMRDEVMAVGDGHNDLPMLRDADVSFTFPDAPEELRRTATHIVPTVGAALHMLEGGFKRQ